MKKLFISFLAIILVLPCAIVFSGCEKKKENNSIDFWDGTTTAINKTENDIIEIDSAEDLAGLAKEVNNGNSFDNILFKLTIDIDLSNREWTPIGYCANSWQGKSFNGIFDGQEHVIYNLKISKKEEGSLGVGLFGFVQGTIKNLKIENANIVGNGYVGTLAGKVLNKDNLFSGTISNCHVKNVRIFANYFDVNKKGDHAGSLIGQINSFNVTNCSIVDATIYADSFAGQFAGVKMDCESKDCISKNTVQRVEVVYNETGKGLNILTGQNIKNEFFGYETN